MYAHACVPFLSSISFTGLVILAGFTRTEDPYANFRDIFDGTSLNGNDLATGTSFPARVHEP
jgi:hypothetical protein